MAVARLAGKLDNSAGSAGGIGDTAQHPNRICRPLMGASNDRIDNNPWKIFLRLDMPLRFHSPVCRFSGQTQKINNRKNKTQSIPSRTINQILDSDFSFDGFGARTGNRPHSFTRNPSIAFRDPGFCHIDLDDPQGRTPNKVESKKIGFYVFDLYGNLAVVKHPL